MTTGIYKSGRELSAKEVKTYIMKQRGWTEQEYTLARKGLTKQLYSYNALMASSGGEREESTAVQLLYKQTKAMKRYGRSYKPTEKLSFIQSLSKTSGSSRSEAQIAGVRYKYETYVSGRFSGLIRANEGARKLAEYYKNDPVLLDKKLSEYANMLHNKIDTSTKRLKGSAIPFGQTYGSDESLDITQFFDEIDEDELPF